MKVKIRKFCASKVEWKYIYELIEAVKDEKIRSYVTNQIQWHVIRANRYRFFECALKGLTVVMPILVIIIQQYFSAEYPWVQAIVLGGATVVSTVGVSTKWHDKKVLYRKTAELLKEETTLYVTHVGQYSRVDHDKRFVMELNRIVQDTNSKWEAIEEKVQTTDKQTKDESDENK